MKLAQESSILFISTFPPRKCGIASFTQDLINAIKPTLDEDTRIIVCALDKKGSAGLYSSPVAMVMDAYQLDSCLETVAAINKDDTIQMVCIEHEFGLYGGESGEFLLGFLALLEKPFIVRFHTVLPTPEPKKLKVVQTIGLLADKIIVMTRHSAMLLQQDYQLNPAKIIVIPHGTHDNSLIEPETLKQKYRLEDKLVLTTFGLLSPNKGIENGIMAMKAISAAFPQAMYVILGQTHPNLLEQEGERYRNYLEATIAENGLGENVRLINEYVPTKKLMEYLALTDIYLFTSKDPNQAVSGTFLYAMSAGCAIISNSFPLAKEMLDAQTGIIIQAGNTTELSEQAIALLKNDRIRMEMGHNAFLKTRDSHWEKVGAGHTWLFNEISGKPAPVALYDQL